MRFEGRIRELVAGHPSLEVIAKGLLAARVALQHEFDRFEKQVRATARCDTRARLLMSIPGVGAIVSVTFAAAGAIAEWGYLVMEGFAYVEDCYIACKIA